MVPFWKCVKVKSGISSQQAEDLVKIQMCSLDIQDLDETRATGGEEVKGFNLNSLRVTAEMLGEDADG